ncbi:YihY/virulence factor BrkB family protein [Robbsia andropogonis]|uniref:YihY/virulence factor BrkB family protein n=1 Tax=Robbsia andropogonis TaxID=28092 RepID=UPI000466CBE5|nr:YihY/virulence factor BrkB family protein [Robbsia andropogonis]MCP1116552.1 YihY/virulence factor BrkB family protein [Robbsia andropogonis]MCP1126769.1 YihY/virulence factor BrkB family protein [Robbsia andropogonis]
MSAVDTTSITQALKKDGSRTISVSMRAAKRFSADKCPTLAAGIAFYSAFSLAPMLLMVIAVAGWFYGAEAARGQLFSRVQGFLGADAAAAIQSIVEHAHRQGGGGFAAILSVLLLIVGASATFSSLNTAFDVVLPMPVNTSRSTVVQMVRTRLVSFSLVLGVAFLLIVSLVLDTAITYIGSVLWQNTPFVFFGNLVQTLVSFVILVAAFGALIKFLPDASSLVAWRDAAWGGAVSAVLFSIGKKLFALYLAHAGTASAFGAAGSLAVLLMWLYFSAAVLLLGAEIAAVRGGFDRGEAEADEQASGGAVSPVARIKAKGARQNVTARARQVMGMAPSRDILDRSMSPPVDAPASARTASRPRSCTRGEVRAAVDRAIARSRHPVLLRVAVQSAPWVLQAITLLLPTRRRVDELARSSSETIPIGRGSAATPRAKRAQRLGALFMRRPRPVPVPVKRGVTRVTGPGSPYGRVASRTRHPIAAALFAAVTGLAIAALANREKK